MSECEYELDDVKEAFQMCRNSRDVKDLTIRIAKAMQAQRNTLSAIQSARDAVIDAAKKLGPDMLLNVAIDLTDNNRIVDSDDFMVLRDALVALTKVESVK